MEPSLLDDLQVAQRVIKPICPAAAIYGQCARVLCVGPVNGGGWMAL